MNDVNDNININNEIISNEENEIKINDDLIEEDEAIKEEEKEEERDKDCEKELKEEEEKKSVDSGLDLTDDKNFERMKEELDKANNFIDYFLVVGLPPKVFMEKWLYQSDIDKLNDKFKDNFQPKVISSFPNYEKHTIAFDDSVISHCFPNGFKAIMSAKPPKTKVFSFILDNNYFNLNFPQKYLTCLICYENILKYKELYDAYKEYMKENNKIEEKNEIKENFENVNKNINKFDESIDNIDINQNIYIPKCLMIMSLYPYFAEFEKILTEIYKYSLIKENEKEKLAINWEVQKNENLADDFIKIDKSEEKQQKKEFKIDMNKIVVTIYKIIENLLIELPVPPRGNFKVQYTLINQERELKQNLMNELPLVDINLKKLFTFDVKEIVKMYHNLFLETRILFFSENIQSLNMYVFGLLSLLYPFQYQYQVVTILPEENFTIIESITPFIAGINMPYRKDFFEIRDLTLSDAILIVDIDNTQIDFVNKTSDIPEFPKGYKKTLEKNLQTIKTKYFKDMNNSKLSKHRNTKLKKVNQSTILNKNSAALPDNSFSASTIKSEVHMNKSKTLINDKQKEMLDSIQELDDDEVDDLYSPYGDFNIDFEFNKEVHELFFNFNANLLSGYNKFLNIEFYSSNNAPCLEVLFKVNEFLGQVSSSDRAFYDKFITETQIFGDFLYLRMIPKNTKEKIQILAFDEKINENSASVFYRPPPSVFINSREYDFVNVYKVQKPRQLTKEEIEFYQKKENKIKLLNYGMIIKEKNGEIIFEYPTFPSLTTKYFFKNNISEYFLPNPLNENVESINTDIVSKSHLGGVAMRLNDMDNYIYLCWMQMWAITFWYCDQNEKRYRFQELLKVLNKTSSHEMEIFNLLFEALSLYGEDYMVLKLYDILLTLHLNPSFKVHNIVMKLLDKKKFEGNIKENLQKSFKDELKNIYNNKNFRKRTFKSKYYGNIVTDEIMFYAFDSCINCQQDIDLESISMNFKEMNRELSWTQCPNCQASILPKLTVQFGKETNKNGKMKQNSCKLDNVVLFSPFFLKDNYNSVALRAVGVKMDVEDLMLKYNNIFWNSLWYFKLKHLEYDFMLPYEEGINKEIDDYLDISIGDDEDKKDNNIEIKPEIKNEEKIINKFDLSALKIEKNEIILKS